MSEDFDKITATRDAQAAYDAIPVIDLNVLQAVISKWLLIVDPGLVKLVLATIIANRIPSDPVWVFLIAPSGGGKTEIMNGLLKWPGYYSLSQLTPNTLLSGMKNKEKETSLLKRIQKERGNGTTIGFKDFTSLLDGNKDDLKAIMGQFRDLYDGLMTKVTGTGDEITWKGKMGFLAGCTPVIEQRMALVGAMGERFLNYKIKNPPRKDLRAKMKANIGQEGNMRDDIQDAVAGYLKGIVIPGTLPVIPEVVDNTIEAMTDFIAVSRAVVMRGMDTKREIEYIVEPEMAGRTYKQLYAMAVALLIMNGEQGWQPEDDYILKKLAVSSIHSIRYNMIKCIMQYRTQVKTATIAMELGYPTSTARRYLEDLAAISMDDGNVRILRRQHQGKGKADLWNLTAEMKQILASMGELVEAVKDDIGLDADEEDLPVGSTPDDVDADRQAYESGDQITVEEQSLGV